jgi:predicted metal-dependent phosphoesterase TrpH
MIDLHIHSNKSSDGNFTPFHIIQLAKKKRMRALSITDHDTVAAYPEAIHLGDKAGVEVIPSLELTTLFDGREFHLLLPFVDWKNKTLLKIINEVARRRFEEAEERVQKLREIGFDIEWKEVIRRSKKSPPLGVSIAQILLKKAEKTKNPMLDKYFHKNNLLFAPYRFYEDYFMEGKPAAVPKKNLSLLEILATTPQTGGVPVLAHPGAYFQQTTQEDLVTLRERGLVGLEVYTTYHDSLQTKFYKKLAEELDLVPTAGSDFHGRIKPHIAFGSLKGGEYWMIDKLRERKNK